MAELKKVTVRTPRPHFGAQQWIDDTEKEIEVTEEQYAELKADREIFVIDGWLSEKAEPKKK